jgi:hypothetical protein
MPQGSLGNLASSAFVRTPPAFAERILRCLLRFPQGKASNVLDPTAGEGDLLLPCRDLPLVRLYGVEISAERTAIARTRLPRAEIVACAFEGVSIPKGSMSLVLANPPYFFQDGKRAEYRILADSGTLLAPGGVLVAIIPARSAWDGTMINHFCRWYDRVRIWKFPDRTSAEEEGAFEDYTQMCVVGIRRAEPQEPHPAEQRRLAGYRYHTPPAAASSTSPTSTASSSGKPQPRLRSGWEQGEPPPDLPALPIADPYPVPEALSRPQIVVRHADESHLLAALERCGAQLTPVWQAATEWHEEGLREPPVMPLSGEAHVAAEVLTGLLDGEIVSLPSTSTSSEETAPHLFTAFVGHQWVPLPIEEEEREKLRERGVVAVSARQWQDKPMLGVLNLQTGETRYEQGDAVFTFLQPWLHTLAARVIEKRQPLYRLDPADWEVRVLSQFGQDKQLPNAPFPGLSLAQQHRVYAMGHALDLTGRTAIQGEPGTGKTRLATATAARLAYQWRYRNSALLRGEDQPEHGKQAQPAWIRGLRRAWLKNPRTLALLGLTPVYDAASHRLIAYRRADGTEIAPEEAGPQALPVLVSTPKKVTKEYGAEVRAAWPEAEVICIERHTDIPRFFQQCAASSAPAVVGMLSHSLTRAFGREWQPVMREKTITKREPVLEPEETLLPRLQPVHDAHGVLSGYRWKASGKLYTKETRVSHFFCPDCGGLIKAIPGKLHEVEKRADEREEDGLLLIKQGQPEEEEQEDDRYEPVTSRTWFTLKPRWCTCRTNVRNQPGPHNPTGRTRVRTPLWTDARLPAAQRKHPQLSFADWSHAVAQVQQASHSRAKQMSDADCVALLRQDEALLMRIMEAALAKEERERTTPLARMVAEQPAHFAHPVTSMDARQLMGRHDPQTLERLIAAGAEGMHWEPMVFRSMWASAFAACTPQGKQQEASRAVSLGLPIQVEMKGVGQSVHGKTNQHVVLREPLADSFSPYMYLYRFYRGCVALAVIDESHNGRGRDTDIAHAHHQAMLSAQMRMLTSGTHFGGDVLSFYHYWMRFHPQFWRKLGLGWNDADKALERYGVIQEWSKEYESDARRGSGQTTVQVSTIPAPGLSAKLIPYLLEDLVYLTVLDVGAHMPPRIEIPEIVSMRDQEIETRLQRATDARQEAARALASFKRECREVPDGRHHDIHHREQAAQELERLQEALSVAVSEEQAVQAWADQRHLAAHYRTLVRDLDDLAKKRNTAARLAKGTVPRWFAALPCDKPFEVWQTTRDRWGDSLNRTLLAATESLRWDHLYPLERRLMALVEQEVSEGRRVMLYVEQNDLRSMARRLAWVLSALHPWTLPNSVAAEERQHAILRAVEQGHQVVIVPYRRVNEGLNLQSGIDTIVWCEMALNLFMLDQASRRSWRLGKREEVRIYYVAYANTAGHHKLRKLGQQSGAAAAFAGEPARGALIEHAGANKTTLARLSSLLEQHDEEEEAAAAAAAEDEMFLLSGADEVAQEEQTLKAVFRQRAEELQAALTVGRTWLGGLSDTLSERLAQLQACPTARVSVWAEPPLPPARTVVRTPHRAGTGTSRSSVVALPRESQHAEGAAPFLPALPIPTPSAETLPHLDLPTERLPLPAASPEPHVEASPAIGSRAEVIFGNASHIALVRIRPRSTGRTATGEHVKRRQPVSERDIPATAETAATRNADEQRRQETTTATTVSLWDWLTAPDAPTTMVSLPATVSSNQPRQTKLW